MKLKENVKKGKQAPRIHNQTRHSPNSHALFATDSLIRGVVSGAAGTALAAPIICQSTH